MTDIIVDASALGSVFLRDEDESLGKLALAIWSERAVRAPAHWPVEVISILVKAERSKRISAATCEAAWPSALALIKSCTVEADTSNDAVFALARSTNLSAQDAAYVELAARLKLPLLTGDRAMARAALSQSVQLVHNPA